MDNLCHSLVGAAMGEAGLARRTRFGMAALVVAANLPDVDVAVFATGVPSVAFRRGWTHGVLAQALLPVLLTGLILALDRWRPPRPPGPRADARALLLIGYAGVLSHVFLDLLNTYGVRLLMPFSGRWFYGDAVFIIDPWLWLVLGLGVWLARRRRQAIRATVALGVATLYIVGMMASARLARRTVWQQWTAQAGTPPRALMVGPVPLTPLLKAVIVDAGDHYRTGSFDWRSRTLTLDADRLPRRDDQAAVRAAARTPAFASILVWSRFPYYELSREAGGTRVTLSDLRFGRRVGAASVVVPP
jgi:inner membrane protein